MWSTTSPNEFLTTNFGFIKVQTCSTVPITCPGGAETSKTFWQLGKQQHASHRNGRFRCNTSFWKLSKIFISNGRARPKQLRVQQSLSSYAKYTFCPSEFFTLKRFFVSNEVKSSSFSIFCDTNNWSRTVKYSRPCGQLLPTGMLIHGSPVARIYYIECIIIDDLINLFKYILWQTPTATHTQTHARNIQNITIIITLYMYSSSACFYYVIISPGLVAFPPGAAGGASCGTSLYSFICIIFKRCVGAKIYIKISFTRNNKAARPELQNNRWRWCRHR